MATPKGLFASGQLASAITALTAEVKAHPTDTARRTFLFELLCFAGEWERAEKQLAVIGQQSAQAEIGVQAYRNCIMAERARQRLFTEGAPPHYVAPPPAYLDLHLQAINARRASQYEVARALLDQAEEGRPALTGSFNGQPFADFRDCDDFVAPVLELVVQGEYTWLPLEQIIRIEMEPPQQLRDLLWSVVQIESEAFQGAALTPILYTGTSTHADEQVRLGRMTVWQALPAGLFAAAGARLFLVDDTEKPLLEGRAIDFTRAAM